MLVVAFRYFRCCACTQPSRDELWRGGGCGAEGHAGGGGALDEHLALGCVGPRKGAKTRDLQERKSERERDKERDRVLKRGKISRFAGEGGGEREGERESSHSSGYALSFPLPLPPSLSLRPSLHPCLPPSPSLSLSLSLSVSAPNTPPPPPPPAPICYETGDEGGKHDAFRAGATTVELRCTWLSLSIIPMELLGQCDYVDGYQSYKSNPCRYQSH